MKKYIYLIIFVFASQLAFAQTSKDTIKDLQTKVEYLEKKLEDSQKRMEVVLDNAQNDFEAYQNTVAWAIGLVTAIFALVGIIIPYFSNKDMKKEVKKEIETQNELFIKRIEIQSAEIEKIKATAIEVQKQETEIIKIKDQVAEILKLVEKSAEKAQEAANESEINKLFSEAYNEKDNYKKIELYTKLIDLSPNYSIAYNNRGIAHSDLKQYNKAIEDYNKAIDSNPNNALAHNNRADVYIKNGDFDKAEIDIEKAISIDPKLAITYLTRAELNEKLVEIEGDEVKKNKYLELAKKDREEYERLSNLEK